MNSKIISDLTSAMKAQDKFKISVLRMLKSALQMESINLKKELSDEEVIKVIKKQVKTRKDSIAEYQKYNKDDVIESLTKEIEILNCYLPAEMDDASIDKLLDEVFEIVKPTSMKDMGAIMKNVNEKIAENNANADMSLVSKKIKERLS